MQDHMSLQTLGVHQDDSIQVMPRLTGGGGDGGVYPLTHHEQKWMYASNVGEGTGNVQKQQRDKVQGDHELYDRLTKCAVSGMELSEPVVICDLGHLYNKDQLIKRIIEKSLEKKFAHIKSLKHMFPATLHRNKASTRMQRQTTAPASLVKPPTSVPSPTCPSTAVTASSSSRPRVTWCPRGPWR